MNPGSDTVDASVLETPTPPSPAPAEGGGGVGPLWRWGAVASVALTQIGRAHV